jgi:hypothetical protein
MRAGGDYIICIFQLSVRSDRKYKNVCLLGNRIAFHFTRDEEWVAIGAVNILLLLLPTGILIGACDKS